MVVVVVDVATGDGPSCIIYRLLLFGKSSPTDGVAISTKSEWFGPRTLLLSNPAKGFPVGVATFDARLRRLIA